VPALSISNGPVRMSGALIMATAAILGLVVLGKLNLSNLFIAGIMGVIKDSMVF